MTAAASPITLREFADIPVERLKGVGDKKQAALADVGIESCSTSSPPTRAAGSTARTRPGSPTSCPVEEALVLVTVRSVTKRMTRNRRTMVNVAVGDGSGRMDVVFFNQPWRERQLSEGLQIALFGKADTYRGGLQMSNPIVDLIGDRTAASCRSIRRARRPRSPRGSWPAGSRRRSAVATTVASPTRCPRRSLTRLGLVDRGGALRSIHAPDSMREKELARRRLAFDELLRVQLVLVLRKRELERSSQGLVHVVDGELVRRFHDALPYPLTGAQRRVIGEIDADLASPHPMHRLLQGDVGSGKTVVAVSMLLAAVQGGHQGALMAPTEVLAEQHATGVRALLGDLKVPDPGNLFGDRPLRVELLTNRVTGSAAQGRSWPGSPTDRSTSRSARTR